MDLLERLRPVLEGNYLAALQERKQAQAAAEEAERLRKRQEIQLAKLKEIQAKLERERLSHSINSSSSSNQPSLDESGHVAISSTVPAGIAQETTSAQVSSVDPVIQVGSEHSVAQTNSVPSSTEPNSTSISTSTETSTLTETPPAHPTAIQAAPSIQDAPSIQPVATAPVQLKQKSRFFSESGRPLRPVHIPASIIDRFLAIAEENTRRNIETCGVIAGKLHQDEFTVTCLIIPKQSGTSDTCSMTNEEEIVEAQDNLDVMTLGWIHVSRRWIDASLFACFVFVLFF